MTSQRSSGDLQDRGDRPYGCPSRATLLDPRRCMRGGLLLSLLALGSTSTLAETYEGFDCPDSSCTEPRSINDRGDIAGTCEDANGVHGFVQKNGRYMSIDVPDAVGTRPFGVNVRGDVGGGWSSDPDCVDCFTHAFLLTRDGFQEPKFPGALETVANGINALGQIVGTYVAEYGSTHGFLRDFDHD